MELKYRVGASRELNDRRFTCVPFHTRIVNLDDVSFVVWLLVTFVAWQMRATN